MATIEELEKQLAKLKEERKAKAIFVEREKQLAELEKEKIAEKYSYDLSNQLSKITKWSELLKFSTSINATKISFSFSGNYYPPPLKNLDYDIKQSKVSLLDDLVTWTVWGVAVSWKKLALELAVSLDNDALWGFMLKNNKCMRESHCCDYNSLSSSDEEGDEEDYEKEEKIKEKIFSLRQEEAKNIEDICITLCSESKRRSISWSVTLLSMIEKSALAHMWSICDLFHALTHHYVHKQTMAAIINIIKNSVKKDDILWSLLVGTKDYGY